MTNLLERAESERGLPAFDVYVCAGQIVDARGFAAEQV
jgi:hypothetical protein